jgi:hypothetical protein
MVNSLSFAVNKKNYSTIPRNFLQAQRFYFTDKPPKGFENFDRKKKKFIQKEKDEVPDEKDEKAKEDEKPEEKKAGKNEKNEKDDKSKKSDSESEENNNNNKGEGPKGENNKDFLINAALFGLIAAVGFSYMSGSSSKEITMIVRFAMTLGILQSSIFKENHKD